MHDQASRVATLDTSRAQVDRLKVAAQLRDDGELDQAAKLCEQVLADDPNHPIALTVASAILESAGKTPYAYSLAKRVTDLRPDRPEGWINLGRCAQNLWRMKEAQDCGERAFKLSQGPKQKVQILCNLGSLMIDQGRFTEAEPYCHQALAIDPAHAKTQHNLGLCEMARGDWEAGFKHYAASVGTDNRQRFSFCGESDWDGTPGKRVAIYGEQGLGDEIAFASMFDEAIAVNAHTVIECDKRLHGLFKRSFPKAKVYGTRGQKDGLAWDAEDQTLDASLISGQLGQFFRKSDADFHSRAYLHADPERLAMWRAYFSTLRKPVIGIAWSGGTWANAGLHRHVPLKDWTPILDSVDAHWVSLQYRDAAEEVAGTRVKQYPWATLSKDYDDTAALVAALDAVVSVPTAVVHLAGALGVPTIAMKSYHSCWKFSGGLRFHPDVELIENTGEWSKTVQATADRLRQRLSGSRR
jgi:tetratricopeptide (TPR) repeat protein